MSNISIQENEYENVVCEIAAILSQPQYVNQCPFEVGNRNQQGVKNLGSLLKHVMHHIIRSGKGLKAQTRC